MVLLQQFNTTKSIFRYGCQLLSWRSYNNMLPGLGMGERGEEIHPDFDGISSCVSFWARMAPIPISSTKREVSEQIGNILDSCLATIFSHEWLLRKIFSLVPEMKLMTSHRPGKSLSQLRQISGPWEGFFRVYRRLQIL